MKYWLVLGLIAGLAGCALSPQQVVLQPSVTYSGARVDAGRAVVVTAVDARESTKLGTRGGLYGDTSVITLANDLTEAIPRALTASFAARGYAVNSGNDEAVRIQVSMEELSYTTPEQDVGFKASVKTGLKVEAWYQDSQFEGRYRVGKERNFVTRPNEKDNAELINAAVSEALERVLDDPKLKAFLAQ